MRERELGLRLDGLLEQLPRAEGIEAPQPPPIRPTIEFSATGDSEALDALAVSDLVVTEDGVPQTLESFQEAVAPMSIVMA